jgi:hypothetical protein
MANSTNILNPQEYVIENVDLILADGTKINLKPVLKELSIYEDLFSNITSGYVALTDAQGFIESFNIIGFNFIRVNFSKYNENETNTIDRYFRVHKIGENFPITRGNEEYVINFVSEETVVSEQKKVIKSYKEKTIKEIIVDILENELNTTRHLLPESQIDDTEGTYSFIISNKKPFQAIQWLCNYAKPTKAQYGHVGADMLFYETAYGYQFRSLQSLYEQPIYAEYNYSPQSYYSPEDPQYLAYGVKNMLNLNIKNHFDSLQGINYGVFANKLLTIDPLLQQYKVTEFKYDDYVKTAKTLNPYSLTAGYTNRNNKTVSETTDAVYKVMTTNAEQRNQELIKNDIEALKTVAPSIGIETYIPYRTAQIGLARYIVVEFGIYGDPRLTVGSKVKLNIPSLSLADSSRGKALNKYYSGNYLVSAVRHMLDFRGRYFCTVEAITDSLASPNVPVDNSNVNIQTGKLV